MTFDPKYGYARIGNNSFTLGGQAAPAPRDSDGGDENAAARRTRDRDYLFSRFGWFWDRRKYSTRRKYTGYTRSSPASRSPTSAAAR